MFKTSLRFRFRQWRARRISLDTARILAAIGRMSALDDKQTARWLEMMNYNFSGYRFFLADDECGGTEIDVEKRQ